MSEHCPHANKSRVHTCCQPLSGACQSNSPLLSLVQGGEIRPPLCLQWYSSVLHSLCTDVNDCMRCEAVENQAPEGFLQDANNCCLQCECNSSKNEIKISP